MWYFKYEEKQGHDIHNCYFSDDEHLHPILISFGDLPVPLPICPLLYCCQEGIHRSSPPRELNVLCLISGQPQQQTKLCYSDAFS